MTTDVTLPFDPEGLADPDFRRRRASVEGAIAAVEALDAAERRRVAPAVLDRLARADEPHARGAWLDVAAALGDQAAALVAQRIGSGEAHERIFIDLLQRIGTPRHSDLLASIALRSDVDLNVRAAAAEALGRIGGDTACRCLEALLEVDDDVLRSYALDGLTAAECNVSVQRIEPHLRSPVTRRAAVVLLAHARPEDALGLVLAYLDDPMPGVRTAATVTASRLASRMEASGRPAAAADMLRRLAPGTRDALRQRLSDGDPEVVRSAIHLLALAVDAEALGEVVARIDDPDVFTHATHLVAALGAQAARTLRELAERTDAMQRKYVFRLATSIPAGAVGMDPEFVRVLSAALDDEDEETAAAAADALGALGARTAMGPLYRAMDRDGLVGEAAADALARLIGTGVASADDLDVLAGATWPIEGAVARHLCRIVGRLPHPRYVPQLVAMLGSADATVRVAAASALGRIAGAQDAVGALSFALADEDPRVRAAACRSLGALEAPEGIGPLLSATRDPSPSVRSAAVGALAALGNAAVFPRLREIVLEDPVPAVVVQAIAGLGKSRAAQDQSLLLGLTTATDEEVLKAVARALAGFPSHRVTAALLGMLAHERWDVRWAAAQALAGRGDVTAVPPLRRYLEREQDDLVRQAIEDAVARLDALAREDE